MRRPTLPMVMIGVVVLALLGYVFFVVTKASRSHEPGGDAAPGASTPPPSDDPTEPPTAFPPAGKVFLGVQTGLGPHDFADLDAFSSATGVSPGALQFTQSWAHEQFNRDVFDRIAERNMLPILSWEPWDWRATGPARSSGEQPRYRLAGITAGEFDPYITSWAEGIKNLDYPVGMRFGHEMNGFWYPWCEQSNGNRRGDYVKAYRHVYQIFKRVGADKVIWLWSPNVTYPGADPLERLYPGDEYVDWIGLSGYYGTAGTHNYRSFNRIFADTFAELRTFSKKPIVITETGATNSDGQRTRWVREMFAQLPKHTDVIGVIWFETRKELDWRLATTPEAAKAFGAGAAQARYRASWSTNTYPLDAVRVPNRG